jgi:hypothetical protein
VACLPSCLLLPRPARGLTARLAALALLALFAAAAGPAHAQTGLQLPVVFPAGWNLIGVTAGTAVAGASGPLYTQQAGDDGYSEVAPGATLEGGRGYWAYFAADTRVLMPADQPAERNIDLPAGRWVMIGNPLPFLATIVGADALYTYDPIEGYHQTTELQPGQGAWAFSLNGATAVAGRLTSPSPEATEIAQQLMPLLIQQSDLPVDLAVLQPLELTAVSNAQYVAQRPDAIALEAQLNLLGRSGGVKAAWQRDVDVTTGVQTPYGATATLSLYESTDGATQGLEFIFSHVSQPPSSTCARSETPPAATAGDASHTLRYDCTFNQVIEGAPGSTVLIRASYITIGWRHGKIVATIQLSAINQDASIADLQTLAQIEEARIEAAGY